MEVLDRRSYYSRDRHSRIGIAGRQEDQWAVLTGTVKDESGIVVEIGQESIATGDVDRVVPWRMMDGRTGRPLDCRPRRSVLNT